MDIVMPQLGETVTEGTVVTWYKQKGDSIARDEVLFEVETEKVTTEVPSPVAGTIVEIYVPAGETVSVGTVLAVIQQAGVPLTPAAASKTAATASSAPGAREKAPGQSIPANAPGSASAQGLHSKSGGEHKLSPVVRRLLAEHNLNPDDIQGTGNDGRITREDVLRAAEGKGTAPAAQQVPISPGTQVIPFNTYRRNTAKHMVRSKSTSPHVLQVIEVDFENVAHLRNARQTEWESSRGFRLTFQPFIARAICLALADFPRLNASVGEDRLTVYAHINLGIAVDLNFEGLVSPVVKGAHTLSLTGLALAIQDKITRARAGTLTADDMTQGTYTLSNAGAYGTLITAPIISQPQVAILSADAISKRPVVVETPGEDRVAIHPVGMLSQSFDHRAVDGAYSGAYLKRLKQIIETLDWEQELRNP